MDELVEALNACRPASSFSPDLFNSLVRRTWQDQAKRIVDSKSPAAQRANYLLDVAAHLEIEAKDVEPCLLQRLENIQYLLRVHQKQSVSKTFVGLHDEIEMLDGESLVWVFENTSKVQQQGRAEGKKWTVFRSILSSLFSKPRYQELAVKVEDTGKLAITNQNLYYVTKGETLKIGLAGIYSITPMKDGVRIQTTQKSTMPSTYITGDGRFTYALLRYVQEQGSADRL